MSAAACGVLGWLLIRLVLESTITTETACEGFTKLS
jgi:hypothetical protein